jgi:hypothetical protein
MQQHVDWCDSENGWTALMVAATVTGIYNRSSVTVIYNGCPVIGIHNSRVPTFATRAGFQGFLRREALPNEALSHSK